MADNILDLGQLPVIRAGEQDILKADIPLTCEEFEHQLLATEHAEVVDELHLFVLVEHIRTCSKQEEHQKFFDEFLERVAKSRSKGK